MPIGKLLRHQQAAHRDLLDIWSYTSRTWSAEQADAYLTEIDRVIHGVAVGDIVGTQHDHAYRKRRVGAHVIFCRENDREIVIVRVLHRRVDVDRHLSE